jgi:hypothetical protein
MVIGPTHMQAIWETKRWPVRPEVAEAAEERIRLGKSSIRSAQRSTLTIRLRTACCPNRQVSPQYSNQRSKPASLLSRLGSRFLETRKLTDYIPVPIMMHTLMHTRHFGLECSCSDGMHAEPLSLDLNLLIGPHPKQPVDCA